MNHTTVPINVDSQLYPALIQCFFIIGAGYIAGQLNLLTNTQSAGLSRFISHFALPAIIFKNLVDIQFESVSWAFLASVMLAKTFLFIITGLLCGIAERPRNFTSMAIYAIMTTQTNDFALIAPIIDAIFNQSHPDFQRYVYLIAPINLVILNPIGFFFIEIQNRLDDRKKNPDRPIGNRWHLIRKILLNITLNPIVICTLLGVIFNRIFHEKLPDIIERTLTPIAQSFNATALFYLGLTMVGKLRQLHSRLIIVVLLLSIIKLIIFPLLLRQTVYFLMKPMHEGLNDTIDYSNLGFLYGTAPTAPSVVVYVPESYTSLQAIASTGLVLSTLLAGPIMLISAKMINLRTLDAQTTNQYELELVQTAFDVSLITLLCTIIVLIGFCLRRHFFRLSVIHKYTFIYVGALLTHAVWTVAMHFLNEQTLHANTMVINLGNFLTALLTRTWASSLSIVLYISICYSTERAEKFWWLYHIYGWLLPIIATLIVYIVSLFEKSKYSAGGETVNFATIQTIAAVFILALCIIISSTNLLRMARRTYKLKQDAHETRRVSFSVNEIEPLVLDNTDETEQVQVTIREVSTETEPPRIKTQSLRQSVLVGIMTINAIICLSILIWSLVDKSQNGLYYELEFLDTVLLHGQGIFTFLIFALDADFLLPISRKTKKLLYYFGLKKKKPRDTARQDSMETSQSRDFEDRIRPEFVRHSSTQSTNSVDDATETIFQGNDFCQWLVSNGYIENESKAKNFCQELVNSRQLVRINRQENADDHWYAFSK